MVRPADQEMSPFPPPPLLPVFYNTEWKLDSCDGTSLARPPRVSVVVPLGRAGTHSALVGPSRCGARFDPLGRLGRALRWETLPLVSGEQVYRML